jgi:hypothetical protein
MMEAGRSIGWYWTWTTHLAYHLQFPRLTAETGQREPVIRGAVRSESGTVPADRQDAEGDGTKTEGMGKDVVKVAPDLRRFQAMRFEGAPSADS